MAHQTIEPEPKKIIYTEIEELFSAVQEILNLISHHYDRSGTSWSHLEKEISHHMEWLFENAERGEAHRLAEIKAKWNIDK